MSRRHAGGVGIDPAAAELIRAATRRLTEQVVQAADTRAGAVRLALRHGNLGNEQRAGFMFELMHADGFNRQAIAVGARARAVVNGLDGAPHAAADLRLVGADGAVREVQAKVYANPVRAAIRQADPAYRGMDRLVTGDQIRKIDSIYDRRLGGNPQALRMPDHADARAHLVDRLRMDDVESVPITRDEVIRAARDPQRWAEKRLAVDAGRQIGAATAIGAATGAVLSGLLEAIGHVGAVRSGETSARDAAGEVANAALGGAVRTGAVAGIGATLQVAALRSGAVSAVVGKVPAGVIASAVVGIAGSAWELACGEIDSTQFVLRACESAVAGGVSWVGGAVGQALIPVPLVGALLGGLGAQWCAALVADGVRDVFGSPAAEIEVEEPADDPECLPDEPPVVMPGADDLDAWLADPDAPLVLDPNVVVAAAA